jgi:hypothetical protein
MIAVGQAMTSAVPASYAAVAVRPRLATLAVAGIGVVGQLASTAVFSLVGIPAIGIFLTGAVAIGCARAPKVRVDDPIIVPFATTEEASAAMGANVARGGKDLAVNDMLIGGALFAVSALVTFLPLPHARGVWDLIEGMACVTLVFGMLWFGYGAATYVRRGR